MTRFKSYNVDLQPNQWFRLNKGSNVTLTWKASKRVSFTIYTCKHIFLFLFFNPRKINPPKFIFPKLIPTILIPLLSLLSQPTKILGYEWYNKGATYHIKSDGQTDFSFRIKKSTYYNFHWSLDSKTQGFVQVSFDLIFFFSVLVFLFF